MSADPCAQLETSAVEPTTAPPQTPRITRSAGSTRSATSTTKPAKGAGRTNTALELGSPSLVAPAADASCTPTLTLVQENGASFAAQPRKRLMAKLQTQGRRSERQYHATRLVTDDHGDAVALQFRCPSCMRWSSLKRWCTDCDGWRKRSRRQADPEAAREYWAESRRRRHETNPLAAEQERKRNRRARAARREANLERERALSRARHKRYMAKVRQDPERHAAYLDRMRMWHAEREGLVPKEAPRRKGDIKLGVLPLSYHVAHAVTVSEETPLANAAGVTTRLFRSWREGKRKLVEWDTADRVLVALGHQWWEVFDVEGAPPDLDAKERQAWDKACTRAAELWG